MFLLLFVVFIGENDFSGTFSVVCHVFFHFNWIIVCVFGKKAVTLQIEMGRVLAIDYGKRRTGLAVTDVLRIAASPLATVPTAELTAFLKDYFSKEEVDVVVIGLPRQMNGEESGSMSYIKPFMTHFRRTFPQIELQQFDERFTSVLAHKAMIDGGMRKKQRQDKAVVDKLAACIILEDWLVMNTPQLG